MVVLRGLKRLRVLNLSQNPTATRIGYRAWILANARRLEVFDNEGVSDAEREGADDVSTARSVETSASRRTDDAESVKSMRRTFGVPLTDLLTQEVSTLPRLVQECTRHVQERKVSNQATLTADGDPSIVLLLRNAFERGGDAGQVALVDCMDATGDADLRAACSVLRAFLLELPQPVVPVDFFLRVLEVAPRRGSDAAAALPTAADGHELEQILAPMPQEHWALLEHLLCFLVNASRPFPEADFQHLLARVWAPCILRAPARTMSQYRGKVIDAMAACVLGLLNMRRDEGAACSGNAGASDEAQGPTSSPVLQNPETRRPLSSNSKQRAALLDSLDLMQDGDAPATASTQLIDMEDEAAELVAVTTADSSTLPEVLARQRASADELLSALEELQDDCSLLDEAMPPAPAQASPPALPASPPPPDDLGALAAASSPARDHANELMAAGVFAAAAPASASPELPVMQQPPPHSELTPAPQLPPPPVPIEPVLASSMVSHALPPSNAALAPPSEQQSAMDAWNYRPPQYVEDDAASMSRLSTSSHRMASAAAAALEAREAEAAKLKQRAQRLLRERSELALDLEGLQDTLSRMERAVARAREQTQALHAERSRYDTSDSRRHSAQISTLSKAVLREKQRRLSARNEAGTLQRQLTKKRTQQQAAAARQASLTREREQAVEKHTQAEAPVHEARRLADKLQRCQLELADLEQAEERAMTDATPAPVPLELRHQEADLEAQLAQLRERASITRPSHRVSDAQSTVAGDRRPSQLVEQTRSVRQALAAEQAHARSAAPAIEAAAGVWTQMVRQLQDEFLLLVPGGRSDFSSPDAAAEAAKWHAEARAFSSEVQRVENLQADAVKAREAEREGWRDFTSETARLRERQHVDGASNVRRDLQRELADVRDALTRAERESEDLLEGGSLARRSLDEAGARLSSLRQVAAQVEREAGL